MRSLTLDRLYVWLGVFTGLYLAASAIEFFSNLHYIYPIIERLLDAFSEPYLGALAIYVVLKEIRKHRGASSARHGERFVIAWLTLLGITTVVVAATNVYRFDISYQLIISNSLASLMIYLGSRLHRP